MKERILVVRTLATVVCVICMLCPLAGAISCYFNGTVDTDWGTAGNWTNGIPTNADLAVLTQAYTGPRPPNTVISSGSYSTKGMTIGNESATTVFTLDINGGTLTDVATGVVSIASTNASSKGTMNVNSGGAYVSNGGYIHLGRYGAGTINVNTGGTFTANCTNFQLGASGGNGQFNVSGGAATVGTVTTFAAGYTAGTQQQINVTGGGTLNVTGPELYVGSSGGESILTVDGGTVNLTKRLRVANSGTATKGVVNVKSGQLNLNATGESMRVGSGGVTSYVNVSGGKLTAAGNMYFGYTGTGSAGELKVTGGEVVSNTALMIGAYNNGHLQMESGKITFGGTGGLGMSVGGYATSLGDGRVDMLGGLITALSGATLNIGTTTTGIDGWFQLDGGTVDLSAGALVINTTGWLDITHGTLILPSQVTSLNNASGYGTLGNLFFDYHSGENKTYVTAPIPEPASIALLVVGSLAMISRRRKN